MPKTNSYRIQSVHVVKEATPPSSLESAAMPVSRCKLEYRSTNDDAWYDCGVLLEDGNRLRIKFKNIEHTYNDELFSLSDFTTNDQILQFLSRFRLESEAIEDNECSKVTRGFTVCAAYTRDNQLRYFDAIVYAVYYKEHTPEKCLCTYLLLWQHGPEAGNITETTLDDIYLIKSGDIDPAVVKFTELVKKKLKGAASFEFTLIPKKPLLSKTCSNETITKSQESGSVGFSTGRERFCPELSDQDRDLGGDKGTGGQYYILLENLEKDLCPLLMMGFIQQRTLVTAQAYVFPSSLAETYARGAILVDSMTKLKRIYEFITNPNHFIVSFSGRPWVILDDKLRTGTFHTNLHSFQPKYENYYTTKNLKVVHLGTEEYTKAKQQRDLYLEFRNHLNGVLQRLAMEEDKKMKKQGPISAN